MRQSLFHVFVAVVSFAASGFSTPVESLLGCWDSTFFYKVFRIERSATNFYISLRGSRLTEGDEQFHLFNPSESLSFRSIDNVRQGRDLLTLVFRRNQCEFNKATESLACESGDLMNETWTEAIYLHRTLDDFGTATPLSSRFPVQHLNLTINPTDGLRLVKSQRFPGTGEVVTQRLRIARYTIGEELIPLNCTENAQQFVPNVPERLVNFLER